MRKVRAVQHQVVVIDEDGRTARLFMLNEVVAPLAQRIHRQHDALSRVFPVALKGVVKHTLRLRLRQIFDRLAICRQTVLPALLVHIGDVRQMLGEAAAHELRHVRDFARLRLPRGEALRRRPRSRVFQGMQEFVVALLERIENVLHQDLLSNNAVTAVDKMNAACDIEGFTAGKERGIGADVIDRGKVMSGCALGRVIQQFVEFRDT